MMDAMWEVVYYGWLVLSCWKILVYFRRSFFERLEPDEAWRRQVIAVVALVAAGVLVVAGGRTGAALAGRDGAVWRGAGRVCGGVGGGAVFVYPGGDRKLGLILFCFELGPAGVEGVDFLFEGVEFGEDLLDADVVADDFGEF